MSLNRAGSERWTEDRVVSIYCLYYNMGVSPAVQRARLRKSFLFVKRLDWFKEEKNDSVITVCRVDL